MGIRGEKKMVNSRPINMGGFVRNFYLASFFLCKVSHSGIASSEISSPLSGKHIGTELASCLLPLPSAAIILRYRPTFWPSSLRGGGARGVENRAQAATDMRNTMKRAEGSASLHTFVSLYIDIYRLRARTRVGMYMHVHPHTQCQNIYMYIYTVYILSFCSTHMQLGITTVKKKITYLPKTNYQAETRIYGTWLL